jgi:flagellar hook assembly protein FlgD
VPLFSQGGISAVSAQQQQAPEPVNLRVGVYDVAGREVRILFDDAIFDMVKNIEWDGNNTKGRRVPSGMYFIKARAGETSDTKKVLVIR